MKKATLLAILFTMLFASPSLAEWTKVTESKMDGSSFYVDFDRIRKHDGFVYFWRLTNDLKPDSQGNLSTNIYIQGDCKLFRIKGLSFTYYKGSMGQGSSENYDPDNPKWVYPTPNSMPETALKAVCSWK
jgi:hypothetical protein